LKPARGGVAEPRLAFVACIANISSERLEVYLALHLLRSAAASVQGHYVARYTLVPLDVAHVSYDKDEVKPRQDRALKVNVVHVSKRTR
jgi:hypothetical protein